jgi:Arc/MetJ-type ribon-helix-helix transcriptional regulator
MSTISIPFNSELEDFINQQIKLGNADSKAELVRRAVRMLKEEEEMNELMKSYSEYKKGEVLSGDLKILVDEFSN